MTNRTIDTRRRDESNIPIFDAVKRRVSILDLYRKVTPPDHHPAKTRGEISVRCPSSGHEDRDPSASLNPSLDVWNCQGCDRGGSVVDMAIAANGIRDPLEAAKWLADEFGIRYRKLSESERQQYEEQKKREEERKETVEKFLEFTRDRLDEKHRQHLKDRGLSDEQIKNTGYEPRQEPKDTEGAERIGLYSNAGNYMAAGRYIIPIIEYVDSVFFVMYDPDVEDPSNKYRFPSGWTKPLAGKDRINPQEPTYLTEGIFDFLSVQAAGLQALCTFGTALKGEHANFLRRLEGMDLRIMLDAGEVETSEKIAGKLWPEIRAEIIEIPGDDGTDPNDLWNEEDHNADAFRQRIESLPREDLLTRRMEQTRTTETESEQQALKDDLLELIHPLSATEQDARVTELKEATGWGKRAIKSDLKELDTSRESRADDPEYDSLEAAGIEVLGETDDGEIILFNPEIKRIKSVPRIDELQYNDAVQLSGRSFEDAVIHHRDPEDPRPDFETFKREIVKESRVNPLGELWPVGQGIHRFNKDRALIVSGTEAALIDVEEETLKPIERPVYRPDGGSGYFIGFRPGGSWISIPELLERMQKMKSEQARLDTLKRLDEILDGWNFKRGGYDQSILIGATLQTLVQAYLEWRPHYGLIGEQGSGKTLLFESILAPMFGQFFQRFDSGSTEAGMRQKLHNPQVNATDSLFIVRDEFERMERDQRKRIMDWMRAANRGGTVTKGTPGQQAPIEFPVQHSFWIGTTEFGGDAIAADWSRMVRLYLDDPEEMDLPESEELKEIGRDLIAISTLVAERARERIKDMITQSEIDVQRRMKENHAAPLAFLFEATPEEHRDTIPELDHVLEEREADIQVPEDREMILQTILSHTVSVDISAPHEKGSERRTLTVGSLLEKCVGGGYEYLESELEACGIRLVEKDDGREMVFFHPVTVQQNVLKGTAYEEKNIKDHLRESEGAIEDRARMSGFSSSRGPRGISIPVERFKND